MERLVKYGLISLFIGSVLWIVSLVIASRYDDLISISPLLNLLLLVILFILPTTALVFTISILLFFIHYTHLHRRRQHEAILTGILLISLGIILMPKPQGIRFFGLLFTTREYAVTMPYDILVMTFLIGGTLLTLFGLGLWIGVRRVKANNRITEA